MKLLFSCGGQDQTTIQWRVLSAKEVKDKRKAEVSDSDDD
jgi:hypothetical protein